MNKRIGQTTSRRRPAFFREWREHRGMSQEQLAEMMGTTKSAVSKVERGASRYNETNLEAWAAALGCEPSDLITRPPGVEDIDALFRQAPAGIQDSVRILLKRQ